MSAILTFIIPVRHPENSRDWAQGMKKLQETAASIANQQQAGWRAIVVANTVAELPDLPAGFSVERVDFPPNPLHEKAGQSTEQFYESFRIDKGRRVLAALLKGRDSRFIMIVDDDDLVSCRLSGFVAARPEANGWTIRDGFVWGDGGKLLYRHNDFSNLCGSCHIVRTDLYGIPERFEDATEDYIKRMLGSHRFIEPLLESAGAPLAPLPFAGAIYRIGHAGAHSRSSTVLRTFVFNPRNLRRPHSVARHISRLRLLSPKLRQEFFGDPMGRHET